jgi:hypothetical protein
MFEIAADSIRCTFAVTPQLAEFDSDHTSTKKTAVTNVTTVFLAENERFEF